MYSGAHVSLGALVQSYCRTCGNLCPATRSVPFGLCDSFHLHDVAFYVGSFPADSSAAEGIRAAPVPDALGPPPADDLFPLRRLALLLPLLLESPRSLNH